MFHATGAAPSSSALHWTRTELNEGTIPAVGTDGVINIVAGSVVISMPDDAAGGPGGNVDVPVRANPAAGLKAFDIRVRFNPLVVDSIDANLTAATAGWALTTNFPSPGTAIISLFSDTALTGGLQDIATIRFHVTGTVGDQTPLDIYLGTTNDGVTTILDDGLFTVCPDNDGDGYWDCGSGIPDCNDSDPAIHPGASDANCDGTDQNCSGAADEGYVSVATSCGVGACASAGVTSCVAGVVQDSCNPNATNGNACPDDGNQCTSDVCGAGVCTHPNRPSGYACGDGSSGDCDAADTCDGSGVCQANHVADGTACTPDTNDCTSDVCGAGVCTHPNLTAGTACGSSSSGECDAADTCNGSGVCQANHVADGTACAPTRTTAPPMCAVRVPVPIRT